MKQEGRIPYCIFIAKMRKVQGRNRKQTKEKKRKIKGKKKKIKGTDCLAIMKCYLLSCYLPYGSPKGVLA